MAHTLPDYTTKYKMTKMFGQVDNAELAARLGSPSAYYRRGNVFWYDDFEGDTLHWRISGDGTGYGSSISTAAACTGSQSVRMTSGSTGSLHGAIQRIIALPIQAKLGIEMSYFLDTDVKQLSLRYQTIKDGSRYNAEVIMHPGNKKIYYSNSAGGSVEIIDDVPFWTTNYGFHKIKLVSDYGTGKYVRVIADDVEVDLAGIAMASDAQAWADGIMINIYEYSDAGNNAVTYIDNVIATMEE